MIGVDNCQQETRKQLAVIPLALDILSAHLESAPQFPFSCVVFRRGIVITSVGGGRLRHV